MLVPAIAISMILGIANRPSVAGSPEFPGGRLLGRQRHRLVPARSLDPIVLVLEGDAVLVDGQQPAIGDRDAVGVARQIAQHLLGSGERLFRVDHTDIAEHALDALAESGVKEIHVIGRRGPVQAKFTTKELRELGEIVDCSALVDPAELTLNAESEAEIAHRSNINGPGNLSLFRAFASRKTRFGRRTIWFRFHLSPTALIGNGRVEKIILTRNLLEGAPFAQVARPTEEQIELPCGLVFRSIGYRGVPIPGLPFDESRGTVPHSSGRVADGLETLEGLYVTGWLKRGPTGIIGTNRADSVETVQSLLAELPKICDREKPGAEALRPLLAGRGIRVLNYQDWLMIDAAEIDRGKPKGKPREKFTRIHEMLAVSLDKADNTRSRTFTDSGGLTRSDMA